MRILLLESDPKSTGKEREREAEGQGGGRGKNIRPKENCSFQYYYILQADNLKEKEEGNNSLQSYSG